LCGYTPFDREGNLEEINAVVHADYKFDPPYWDEISDTGKIN